VPDRIDLEFYFDPSCRWAWWTSIWIRRVARNRAIAITWKLFSLAVQDNPDDYRQPPARAHHIKDFDLHRVLSLARRSGGNAAVDRLFVAFGNVLHGSREDIWDAAIQRRCLEAAGLPPSLFDEALQDPSTEADVIAETRAALDLGVLGTPSLALACTDNCMLGPIIGHVPAAGEEALRLWDNVFFTLSQPYVYEIKRNRKSVPDAQFAD
jgi:predicted DsbA family dithiol-disulfide isomerase